MIPNGLQLLHQRPLMPMIKHSTMMAMVARPLRLLDPKRKLSFHHTQPRTLVRGHCQKDPLKPACSEDLFGSVSCLFPSQIEEVGGLALLLHEPAFDAVEEGVVVDHDDAVVVGGGAAVAAVAEVAAAAAVGGAVAVVAELAAAAAVVETTTGGVAVDAVVVDVVVADSVAGVVDLIAEEEVVVIEAELIGAESGVVRSELVPLPHISPSCEFRLGGVDQGTLPTLLPPN